MKLNTIKLRTLIPFLMIFIIGCTNKQPKDINKSKEPLFDVSQLQEDFKVFQISLEEIHPGLYSFISKDSMDYLFHATFSRIDHPMSKDEFFKILAPLVRQIYDEHTSLDFSYKYDSLDKFMPIKIRWVNGSPYIYKNLLDNPSIILGSEVTSINGLDPKKLFKEMKKNYRNGTTDEMLDYDVYSLHFDYLYASFIEQPDSFQITAINPVSKKEYSINSPALLKTDTLHFLPIYILAENYCKKDTSYKFSIDNKNNYAKMTISGLSEGEMTESNIDFYKKINDDFKKIADSKINNLIIDLRYCFGGDPRYGAALLSYFNTKPFHIFDSISARITKTPTYSEYMEGSTETVAGSWEQLIKTKEKIVSDNSFRNYYTNFRDTLYEQKKNQFKGDVYLLVNSDMHSAAAVTSTLIDYYSNTTIIGTPIQGPYNSGNALETIYLSLPNSKIGLDIPLFHYSYAVPDNIYPNKKGLIPDVYVQPTIVEILNGKDAVLEKAIEIIRGKK